MTIYLTELDADSTAFPAPSEALDDPDGLLAIGGDLSTKRLISAYQNGIFPWYGPGEPILWWSPSQRAIFRNQEFKPSRSLVKYQKRHQYHVTINHATERVIQLCASTRSAEHTWLNDEMQSSYIGLAQHGICHSVEVWNHSDTLVGGFYGLSFGKVFCGESMFSLESNTSKIALWLFCQHFTRYGGELIDCQVINPHTASMGAIELPRAQFLKQLRRLQALPLLEGCFDQQRIIE